MKNYKTTLTGLVTGLAVYVKTVYKLDIPTEAILTIGFMILSWFSKDSDVTGGTRNNY